MFKDVLKSLQNYIVTIIETTIYLTGLIKVYV